MDARLAADLTVGILRAVAWPMVILISVVLLRHQLKGLVDRARNGEVDALGVKLRFDLAAARSAVEATEAGLTVEGQEQASSVEWEDLFEDVSEPWGDYPRPQGMVVRAFVALTIAVSRCGEELGVLPTREECNARGFGGEFQIVLDRLRELKVVDQRLRRVIRSLHLTYSRAGRSPEKFNSDDADTFVLAVMDVAQALTNNTSRRLQEMRQPD